MLGIALWILAFIVIGIFLFVETKKNMQEGLTAPGPIQQKDLYDPSGKHLPHEPGEQGHGETAVINQVDEDRNLGH